MSADPGEGWRTRVWRMVADRELCVVRRRRLQREACQFLVGNRTAFQRLFRIFGKFWGHPQVAPLCISTICRSIYSIGYSQPRQQACAYFSGGEIIVLLDSDPIPIRHACAPFQNHQVSLASFGAAGAVSE